jgi:hypothetical protein
VSPFSLKVMPKNKFSGRLGPCLVIFMGALLLATKRYSLSAVGPVEEGKTVILVGALLCALGLWGLIQTWRSKR